MSYTQNEILTMLESVKQQVEHFDAVLLNNPQGLRFEGNPQFMKLEQDCKNLSNKLKQYNFYLETGQSIKHQEVSEELHPHANYLIKNLSDAFQEQTEELKTGFKQQNPLVVLDNYQSPDTDVLYINKNIPQANRKPISDLIKHVKLKYEYHVHLLFINEILDRIQRVLEPLHEEEEEEEDEKEEQIDELKSETSAYGEFSDFVADGIGNILNNATRGAGRLIVCDCGPYVLSFIWHRGWDIIRYIFKTGRALGYVTGKVVSFIFSTVKALVPGGSFLCNISKNIRGIFTKDTQGNVSTCLICTMLVGESILLGYSFAVSGVMGMVNAGVVTIGFYATSSLIARSRGKIELLDTMALATVIVGIASIIGGVYFYSNSVAIEEPVSQGPITFTVDELREMLSEAEKETATATDAPATIIPSMINTTNTAINMDIVLDPTNTNNSIININNDSKLNNDNNNNDITINTTIEALLPISQNINTAKVINNVLDPMLVSSGKNTVTWNITRNGDDTTTFFQNGSCVAAIKFYTPISIDVPIQLLNEKVYNEPEMEWYQIMTDGIYQTVNNIALIAFDPAEYKAQSERKARGIPNIIAEQAVDTGAAALSISATSMVANTLGFGLSLVPAIWKNWRAIKVLTHAAVVVQSPLQPTAIPSIEQISFNPRTSYVQPALTFYAAPSYTESMAFSLQEPIAVSGKKKQKRVGNKKNKQQQQQTNYTKAQLKANIRALNRLFTFCLKNTPISDQFDILRMQVQAL